MLSAPFTAGVGIFAFYALQPYLLQLYGDPTAYGIAGLAAAIVAGAQIVGGLIVHPRPAPVPPANRRPAGRGRRDRVLLVVIGLSNQFLVVLALIVAWALIFAIEGPLRQAYLNGIIPSEQRATVLSFDNLMGSAGGVVFQPILGRVADVNGYGASYVVGGAIQALALPFIFLARREKAVSDPIRPDDEETALATPPRPPSRRPGVCSEARATDREDPCRDCSSSPSRARTRSGPSRWAARRSSRSTTRRSGSPAGSPAGGGRRTWPRSPAPRRARSTTSGTRSRGGCAS